MTLSDSLSKLLKMTHFCYGYLSEYWIRVELNYLECTLDVCYYGYLECCCMFVAMVTWNAMMCVAIVTWNAMMSKGPWFVLPS